MQEFFDAFAALTQTRSVWIYLIIFFGKLTEVTTSTLRIVLINRGIRLVGSLLAVVEIILWLIITSTVLTGFQSDPFKILVYAAAFGMGNFLGSWLDEKLAFGLSSIQIVVSSADDANNVCRRMREKGFGITAIDVHGMGDEKRYMMLMMIKRKLLNEALGEINRIASSAVITVSDVKVQKGGYLRNSPTRSIVHPHKAAATAPAQDFFEPTPEEAKAQCPAQDFVEAAPEATQTQAKNQE